MLQTCSKLFGLSTATWHCVHVMNEISMHTQALFVYTVYVFSPSFGTEPYWRFAGRFL